MSSEEALQCAQAYVDLFLVGDEVRVDLFYGDEREALITAFEALGYSVTVHDEEWAFTIQRPKPDEQG